MLRRTLPFLMIAVVLCCPLSTLVEVALGGDVEVACCTAHPQPAGEPADSRPTAPLQEDMPQNCFCDGAIVEPQLEQPLSHLQLLPTAFPVVAFVALRAPSTAEGTASKVLSADGPLAATSGRQILALVARLLL